MLTNSSSEPLILGVDIGYGNVKVYGSQHRGAEVPQQFHFPALAVPCDELAESGTNFLQAHQVKRMCVDDIEYFVGPDAPPLSFRRLSTQLDRVYADSKEECAVGLEARVRSGLVELDILTRGFPSRPQKRLRACPSDALDHDTLAARQGRAGTAHRA